MKMKPKPKETKLLLNLMDGERHRHRVALVTEEGEWNQHEPNSGMARMFVVMLLIHVVLIGGIIIYDFMGDEEKPQQTVTQAARAVSNSTGLPVAAPDVVTAQAKAAADTEQFDNYEMHSGDSIKSIAAKFSSTEAEITRLNMIDKGLQIGPGTMLRVPKQAVPSAIPVNPKTLKPMVVTEDAPKAIAVVREHPPVTKVPSEAVKPADAPASLSAATMSPMSLVTPSDAPPATSSLIADADTPATASAPPAASAAVLPPPSNPHVVSLLQENAPKVEASKPETVRPRDRDREEPKPAAKAEAKPLAKPSPVPPPSQMLKKIADSPPATKKTEKSEPVKKVVAEAPPKTVPKAAAGRSHTLKPGETLYRLSAKYGVSVAAIQKANNIKNPNSMRDGMKLVIPAK
jgi:LysM repeat protein